MIPTPKHSQRLRKKFLIAGTILSIVVFGVGVMVLAFYAQNRQRSYDDASKAYLPTGGVAQLSLVTPPTTPAAQGTQQKIPLRFSTQRAPISGLQVIVDVKKADGVSVEFAPNDAANFILFAQEKENITGGVRFKLAFGSNPLTTPFNNDTATRDLGFFQYTQPNSGNVVFEFQSETRTVAAETGDDTLTKPNPLSYTYKGATVVADATSPTPTTSSTGSTPSPSPTPTTASNQDQGGVGGTTVLSCNDSCTSTSQCPVNTFCSSGRCRHVSCPSQSNCSCQPTPTPTPRSTVNPTPTSLVYYGTTGNSNTGSGTGTSGSTGSTGGSRNTGSTRSPSRSTGSTGTSGSGTSTNGGSASSLDDTTSDNKGGDLSGASDDSIESTQEALVRDLNERMGETTASPEPVAQEEATQGSNMLMQMIVPGIAILGIAFLGIAAFLLFGRRGHQEPARVAYTPPQPPRDPVVPVMPQSQPSAPSPSSPQPAAPMQPSAGLPSQSRPLPQLDLSKPLPPQSTGTLSPQPGGSNPLQER